MERIKKEVEVVVKGDVLTSLVDKETVKAEIQEEEYTGPKVFRWRKLGGGSLRLPNRIIKPGEIFTAAAEELPKSFMDALQCLDEVEMKAYEQKRIIDIKRAESVYDLEEVDGGWNVVGDNGKPINEFPYTKEDAEQLKSALEA